MNGTQGTYSIYERREETIEELRDAAADWKQDDPRLLEAITNVLKLLTYLMVYVDQY